MKRKNTFQKILYFFLTKIIIGIVAVGSSVAVIEWAGRSILEKIKIPGELKNGIIGISEATAALFTYIFIFRIFEK